MGIGTSKGAFYEDEFQFHSSVWDPKYDPNDDKMVVTPNETYTNKALDNTELDPSTGLGIEVRAEVEDRRGDIPNLTMERLMDPHPLTQSIEGGPRNSVGALSDIPDPWVPTDLAKQLGINDMDVISLPSLLGKLGIKRPLEENTAFPNNAEGVTPIADKRSDAGASSFVGGYLGERPNSDDPNGFWFKDDWQNTWDSAVGRELHKGDYKGYLERQGPDVEGFSVPGSDLLWMRRRAKPVEKIEDLLS